MKLLKRLRHFANSFLILVDSSSSEAYVTHVEADALERSTKLLPTDPTVVDNRTL